MNLVESWYEILHSFLIFFVSWDSLTFFKWSHFYTFYAMSLSWKQTSSYNALPNFLERGKEMKVTFVFLFFFWCTG